LFPSPTEKTRKKSLTTAGDVAEWSHNRNQMNAPYLIQFELDGQWHTIATRKSFDSAKAKAKSERRGMNGVYETSIIREGDPESLRRKTCDNFQLA
jgi:hypothetical protein